MLEIFRTGGDIHATTASEIFGVPLDKVDDKTQRRPAKTVNFGIFYGMSPSGLLQNLAQEGIHNWTFNDCADFIEKWFALFPGVQSYAEAQKAHARRYGLVRDIFNRMRLIPDVKSGIRRIVEEGLRKAVNGPIQMGAQGIIKEAMGQLVPVYREFKNQGYIFRPLIQIHDDILWEVEDGLLETVVPLIKGIQEAAVEISVPVVVDMKVGKRWNNMEKW